MNKIKFQKKVTSDFYTREVLVMAEELLGKIFVRKIGAEYLCSRIVEVEAYDGSIDEAAHSYRGRTKRNEVMFRDGGLLYVYFTYGMYFCCNVVAGKKDEGRAVLLRGMEPLEGIDRMARNRYGKKVISDREKINLSNGPGKICIALNIKREQNGADLCGEEIFILNSKKISKDQIKVTERVGIKKSVDFPWRFYIKNNPYVSKK